MTQKKEKIKLEDEIEVPNGISAEIHGDEIIMKKDSNSVRRKLNKIIHVKIEGNKIILSCPKSNKKERKNFGSAKAHLKNLIDGLNQPWIYKLQIATVHFPVTASIDKATNEFVLKNFLGEKKDRKMKLNPDVEIKVTKDIIELSSPDIEKAGQIAANLEKMTKVRHRDRRIFQDGIFITEKPGRSFI